LANQISDFFFSRIAFDLTDFGKIITNKNSRARNTRYCTIFLMVESGQACPGSSNCADETTQYFQDYQLFSVIFGKKYKL
jgi:hypothetical protein